MKIDSLYSVKHFDSIEIEGPITQRQEYLYYCLDHGYRITRSGQKIKGLKVDKETYLIKAERPHQEPG